ncbi:hypothetical protein B0H13DRAFT_1874165 [Mycena leptocephala]|nr:hypothetical protein B0H13DRAFT_1874165 [Mycena leptocephala]
MVWLWKTSTLEGGGARDRGGKERQGRGRGGCVSGSNRRFFALTILLVTDSLLLLSDTQNYTRETTQWLLQRVVLAVELSLGNIAQNANFWMHPRNRAVAPPLLHSDTQRSSRAQTQWSPQRVVLAVEPRSPRAQIVKLGMHPRNRAVAPPLLHSDTQRSSRAQTQRSPQRVVLAVGANREFATPTQSWGCSVLRPEVAHGNGGIIAANHTCTRAQGALESVLNFAGIIGGRTTATPVFVPAGHQAHGPSLGWLPDVFRGASLGSFGVEAVQTLLPAMLPPILFLLIICALGGAWKWELSKSPSLYRQIPGIIFSARPFASLASPVSSPPPEYSYAPNLLDGIAEGYARSVATGSRRNGSSNNCARPGSGSSTSRNRRSRQSHGDQDSPLPRRARTTNPSVNVMYWNIFHDFTLKLTSLEFQSLLTTYDIMFFAETDMLPGEEDAADVPAGYILICLPRKPLLNNSRRGGENGYIESSAPLCEESLGLRGFANLVEQGVNFDARRAAGMIPDL